MTSRVLSRLKAADADAGLAEAVLSIGQRGFPDRFLQTLQRVTAIDHCMVFAFRPGDRTEWLMTVGDIPIAADLGQAYAGQFHAADPNKEVILAAAAHSGPVLLPFAEARMYPAAYRRLFFQDSGIVDKYATALWHGKTCFYVNFYRTARSGRFTAGDIVRLSRSAAAYGAAIVRHLEARPERAEAQDIGPADLSALFERAPPLRTLSPRERDVCAHILLGYSSEAIAAHLDISLNSVLTYRRRAYGRLGITAQNGLFALVLRVALAAGTDTAGPVN